MKRNIDLTESGDFRKPFSLDLTKILSGYRYPWDCKGKEMRSFESENVLVETGNRKERQRQMKRREWHNECERCGADRSRTPWFISYGLCNDCMHLMDNEFKYENDLFLGSRINRIK